MLPLGMGVPISWLFGGWGYQIQIQMEIIQRTTVNEQGVLWVHLDSTYDQSGKGLADLLRTWRDLRAAPE